MNGGTADIGALLDPGPELPSYDPAWEARWDKANALLRWPDPKASGSIRIKPRRKSCGFEALKPTASVPQGRLVKIGKRVDFAGWKYWRFEL